LFVDGLATVIPVVPGGAAAAIKASRLGNKALDAAQGVDKARDAAQSLENARGISQRILNAANHVFGPKSLGKHNLDSVLKAFDGDTVAAFRALETEAQLLANQGLIRGVFESTVEVAGQTVTIRGAIIEGTARVSTAFIPAS
jgi:hypothetical protein